MEQKYIAFISYRHVAADMAAAKALHSLIEQFNIPASLRKKGKKRFGRVFRDQEELAAASDLSENICRALDNSEYLILLCSHASAQSPWVKREVEYFLRHHDRSKIFAILLDGEPSEVFPAALTDLENADGSVMKLEPLAVDIRADSRSAMLRRLRREIPRLYAAMLGCPYDALVQRQQRRRRRRAAIAISAILAVALSFSGVLLVKNRQIDSQNRELESKNEELIAQREQILLRESELLTQNARAALEEGRYSLVIDYAIAALYGEDGTERPYYAPAEQLLMEALDIFNERGEEYLLVETEIEQLTAISDYAFSADGKRLVSYDEFGALSCFDCKDGKLLWSLNIPVSSTTHYYDYEWPLIACESQNSVIALYCGTLVCVSIETGEILWKLDSISVEDSHLHLSPDESELIYLTYELDPSGALIYHKLVLLSAENGKVLQEIDVGEAQPINYYISDAGEGSFSTDGRYYAFSRCVLEDNVSTLSYFVADLDAGTARCVFSEAVPSSAYDSTVEDIQFTKDGSAILSTRLCPESAIEACIEKIDIESGEKLWKALPEVKAGEEVLCSYSDPIQPLHTASKTYLVRGNALYCISHESGKTEWYTLFPEKLSCIDIVQNQFFSYVLQDGYHALAWKNDAGLFSSEHFSATAYLGGNSKAKLWSEGFIRAEVKDFNIESISVAGSDERGLIAMIPADNNHQLRILRAKPSLVLPGQRSADISSAGKLYGPSAALADGKLAVGLFTDDSLTNRHLAIFNAESLDFEYDIPVEFLTDTAVMPLLPDVSGYIQDDGYGGISLRRSDGSALTLSESSNIMLYDSDIVSFTANEYESRTLALPSDGSLLSVRCSAEELRLWKNGGDELSIPLPGGMIWAVDDNTVFHRIFEVGENGLIVLSRFENGDDLLMEGFELYDVGSGKWSSINDEGGGEADRLCVIGRSSPVFAVAEHDGRVWLYDIGETGTSVKSFSLLLPLSSVDQMSFILGDSVLMVKTADSQLLFYDAASGEILLRQALGSVNLEHFTAYEDSENARLYVADTGYTFGPNGYLIDLSGWTVLAELEGVLHYDAATNELYRILGGELIVTNLPDTSELVKLGRAVLE